MPTTTIASTSDVDAHVAAASPPVRARAEALFAELEAHRAGAAELQARHAAHAGHMRKAKAEPKEALVQRFIERHKATLQALSERERCGFLRRRMEAAQCRGEDFEIPTDKFIRRCLNESGFLTKNDHTHGG